MTIGKILVEWNPEWAKLPDHYTNWLANKTMRVMGLRVEFPDGSLWKVHRRGPLYYGYRTCA